MSIKKREDGFYAAKVRKYLNEYNGVGLEEFLLEQESLVKRDPKNQVKQGDYQGVAVVVVCDISWDIFFTLISTRIY